MIVLVCFLCCLPLASTQGTKMESDDPTPPDSGPSLPPPRGYNTGAASNYLGLSTSWLRKARIGATSTAGPKFRKVGRRIIYTKDALDNFLDDS